MYMEPHAGSVCVQMYTKPCNGVHVGVHDSVYGVSCRDCGCAGVHGVSCRDCVNAGVNKLCIAMSLGLPGVPARCRSLGRILVLLTLTDSMHTHPSTGQFSRGWW